jgi:uncharacterized protein (TIGR02996 family)
MARSSPLDGALIDPQVRSFFRNIKENPDDDAPRLIFADWLQERGDAASSARGEFLRLNVLRHRLSPEDFSYGVFKRREGELFTEHRWTWLGPLVDAARAWTFERGMIQITAQVEKLRTPEVTAWSRTEAALWIDALSLPEILSGHRGQIENHIDYPAYSPLLAHLNRLDLSGNADPIVLRLLFRAVRAHNLPFLSQLILSQNRLRGRPILSLSGCPHFRRLTLLDLQYNHLNDYDAHLLILSSHLKNLTTLRLGHNRFSAEGRALLRGAFGERVQL